MIICRNGKGDGRSRCTPVVLYSRYTSEDRTLYQPNLFFMLRLLQACTSILFTFEHAIGGGCLPGPTLVSSLDLVQGVSTFFLTAKALDRKKRGVRKKNSEVSARFAAYAHFAVTILNFTSDYCALTFAPGREHLEASSHVRNCNFICILCPRPA